MDSEYETYFGGRKIGKGTQWEGGRVDERISMIGANNISIGMIKRVSQSVQYAP